MRSGGRNASHSLLLPSRIYYPAAQPPRPPTNRARCPDADALTDGMCGRDPARVHPSCVAKVQARARFVILAREALGGGVAEGAAGGRAGILSDAQQLLRFL